MPKIKDDEGSSNSESSLAPVGFTLCSHVLVNGNGIVAEYSYSLNVLIYCIIDRCQLACFVSYQMNCT